MIRIEKDEHWANGDGDDVDDGDDDDDDDDDDNDKHWKVCTKCKVKNIPINLLSAFASKFQSTSWSFLHPKNLSIM